MSNLNPVPPTRTPLCSRCPRVRPPVTSSGPSPARVLFIGECPSYHEDKQGCVFVGKTGIELDYTYLPILGIPRSEVYVTNAVLCSRLNYANPEPEDAVCCARVHLAPLLAVVKPEIVVPMGAVACALFPEINLNLDHGLPCVGSWGAWEGVVWPMYHPSAGIHATSFMIPLQADFAGLREFLRRLDSR